MRILVLGIALIGYYNSVVSDVGIYVYRGVYVTHSQNAAMFVMAVGEWVILAGPGWATAPTLDGGEWDQPGVSKQSNATQTGVPVVLELPYFSGK